MQLSLCLTKTCQEACPTPSTKRTKYLTVLSTSHWIFKTFQAHSPQTLLLATRSPYSKLETWLTFRKTNTILHILRKKSSLPHWSSQASWEWQILETLLRVSESHSHHRHSSRWSDRLQVCEEPDSELQRHRSRWKNRKYSKILNCHPFLHRQARICQRQSHKRALLLA